MGDLRLSQPPPWDRRLESWGTRRESSRVDACGGRRKRKAPASGVAEVAEGIGSRRFSTTLVESPSTLDDRRWAGPSAAEGFGRHTAAGGSGRSPWEPEGARAEPRHIKAGCGMRRLWRRDGYLYASVGARRKTLMPRARAGPRAPGAGSHGGARQSHGVQGGRAVEEHDGGMQRVVDASHGDDVRNPLPKAFPIPRSILRNRVIMSRLGARPTLRVSVAPCDNERPARRAVPTRNFAGLADFA